VYKNGASFFWPQWSSSVQCSNGAVNQWRHGSRQGRNCPPTILAYQKIFFVRKFSSKNTKFEAKNYPFWGNLETPVIFSVRNLQLYVGKLHLPATNFAM